MKKFFKSTVSLSILVLLVSSLYIFQSCDSNEEPTITIPSVEPDFEKALMDFYNDCKLAAASGKTTRSGECAIDTMTLIKDVQKRVAKIMGKYDIYADLDSVQLKGMLLTEDDYEIMKLDTAALDQFLVKYKTPTFRTKLKCKGLVTSGINVNSVVKSKEYKMNEKLVLVTLLAVEEFFPIDHIFGVQQDACEKAYANDVNQCQISYALDILMSACGGEVFPVLLGISTIKYLVCLSNANDNYQACTKN